MTASRKKTWNAGLRGSCYRNRQFWLPMVITWYVTIAVQPTLADRLVFDVGSGLTWGEFTVEDVTAKVKTNFINPALWGEYRFGEKEIFAVGLGFAQTGNEFEGEWTGDEGKYDKGELTVDRTNFDLYLRIIPDPHVNFRLGYRYLQYEFSEGYLEKKQYGEYIEIADNAKAKGRLSTGFDGEFNFIGGTELQFRFGIGFGYFVNGDYNWSYDRTQFNPERHDSNKGKATQDAIAIRLRPELNYLVKDNLRIRLDYTLSAAIWKGTTDQAEIEDYAGVDVYSAIGLGVEYQIPL